MSGEDDSTALDRLTAVAEDAKIDPEFSRLVSGLAEIPAPAPERRLAAVADSGGGTPLLRVETLAPSHFAPGDVVAITNVVHVVPGARTYAVEHRIRSGWELVSIGSSGHYDDEK